MYNVSSEFLTEIKEPSRVVDAKVFIGTTELNTNTIVDFSIESSMGSSAMPTIGGVVSNKLKLKLINDVNIPVVLIGIPIIPYVSISVPLVATFDNFILNGDFSQGTAYWSDFVNFTDNTTYVSTDSTRIFQYQTPSTNIGDKIYVSSNIRVTSASNLISYTFTDESAFGQLNNPLTNTWYHISGITTKTSTNTTLQILSGASSFDIMKNVIMLNLTTIFGAGNEPTKEEMDSIIGNMVWFEGETSVDTFKDEWIKLGEFYADTNDVVKTKQIITIDAFDNMVSFDQIQYASDLVFPVSLESFIDDIVTTYGISFVGVDFASYGLIINEKPTGSLRQIFGWVASLLTKNAIVDENGDITFKYINPTTFAFDSNNYIDFKLTSDSIVEFTQLQVPKGDGQESLLFGDGSGKSINFENPLILTNGELQTVYEREFPLAYYPYTMTTQGFPHLQIGDVVAFTDVSNVTRNLIITNHVLKFNGGLSSSFKVEAPKENTITTSTTSGSTVGSAITKAYDSLLLEIAESTNLITGNSGGYVAMIKDPITGKPQEIIITDTDDINTAMKVWRWNASGLGFSSTGYNGDYELAINELGKINANFITTGYLNADIIKAGILESLDGKSSINMTNGTFSFGEGRLRWDGSDTLIFGAVNGQQNITISNSQIQFLYNDSATAYINQQKMFITNLEVTSETIMGVHKITKYNNNMTIVKYIG